MSLTISDPVVPPLPEPMPKLPPPKPSDILFQFYDKPQIRGRSTDGNGGYCALGVIYEFGGHAVWEQLGPENVHTVQYMNDYGYKTFFEIGMWLQSQGL